MNLYNILKFSATIILVATFILTWKMKNNDVKVALRIIASIIFIPFFLIFCYKMFNTIFPPYHGVVFEKSKWKQMDDYDRYLMVDDIVDRKLLIGKTKKEVTELLGEGRDNYPKNNPKSQWYYFIGRFPRYTTELDGSMLFVTFENGVVKDVSVTY